MEIVFDRGRLPEKIHPASGVFGGDSFYFGVVLPLSMSDTVGEHFCLVTSQREWFPATEEELDKRNIKLSYPVVWTHRWSLKSIRDFLEGNHRPAELKELVSRIVQKMKTLIELTDEREYRLVALWCIGTYCAGGVFKAFPYLAISGVFRSGKSKLLTFIEQVAFNPIHAADISTSVLYRLIQSLRATVLLDEAEALSKPERKLDLKNLLLVGYKEGGKVYRATKGAGDIIYPEAFDVFSPKAVITYTGVEQILAERSIPIVMLRTVSPEIGRAPIVPEDPFWQEIRDEIYCWVLSNWRLVKHTYEELEAVEGIEQRSWELWKPILTLARIAGDDVYEEMRQVALEKIQQSVQENIDESRQMILLQALKNLVRKDRYYSIGEIKQAVIDYLEEGEDTRWVTNQWIGSTLSKSFKITGRKRESGRALRFITVERVRELCRRYGVPYEERPVYSDEQVKLKLRELSERGATWEQMYEVAAQMGVEDPERVFNWICEIEADRPRGGFLTECKFEGERTEGGVRICPLANIPYCAVENPARCPIARRVAEENGRPLAAVFEELKRKVNGN